MISPCFRMIPIEPTIMHRKEHPMMYRYQIVSIDILISHRKSPPNRLPFILLIYLDTRNLIKQLIKDIQAVEIFIKVQIMGSHL